MDKIESMFGRIMNGLMTLTAIGWFASELCRYLDGTAPEGQWLVCCIAAVCAGGLGLLTWATWNGEDD